jgi:hypothetical protein
MVSSTVPEFRIVKDGTVNPKFTGTYKDSKKVNRPLTPVTPDRHSHCLSPRTSFNYPYRIFSIRLSV